MSDRNAEHRAIIEKNTVLTGHTSPDTAYVVDDYPYGFRLRCSIRYWLEYKKGHGFRFMSQTSNPKKPGLVWNKPKGSTYQVFAVMVLNEDGHVSYDTASSGGWTDEATLQAIEDHYADALTDEHRKALRYIRATNKANEVVTVTIGGDGPRQTHEEQADIMRKALTYGYANTKG